jgi:hypothetical protein
VERGVPKNKVRTTPPDLTAPLFPPWQGHLSRGTPHCLHNGQKASIRELKKELAVAEYGVKVLRERGT